jgi:hypothetical protein
MAARAESLTAVDECEPDALIGCFQYAMSRRTGIGEKMYR